MSATFHHGTLESQRLKNLLEFIRGRGRRGVTPMDMIANCGTTRPTSDISELRANGVAIYCDFERCTETGRKVFRYRVAEESNGQMTFA
jgi:hypothetical protein